MIYAKECNKFQMNWNGKNSKRLNLLYAIRTTLFSAASCACDYASEITNGMNNFQCEIANS